ncbi:tRNA (5-methylaminomethyl-2-thiouridylate)-methyltransferase [Heliomicrobium modesticaldum Ice1]|uniref:tRNA-specific 2-thiouridylase MnmA n=1 Tax=Heliobacterium modesticaldum (strain ATCC 51547 / Ice1) TaxID=498761 RepID=MNMA_HELMI|nr:tRNA 2-thiouridine(34) synthase MnmA [Heliomicrobium modesticaldum]B0TFA7.1 RecName: Full=tRNA-specific 2-thiouridylase MnmA [Heliomicrobium modesticaldum Ice1]ABZ84424.1 tRNA (5-methylaminomethyl-2-thiouridylate)-methyltransferase [Heliomicrobium modesticaldum Ice1]
MKETVVVAMSGGVDSSVTAALLLEQGYDVIGVTLQIWPKDAPEGAEGGCCSLSAVEDAKRVASKLGVPHYVLNFRDYFETEVIEYFGREYLAGQTPNPCIRCNRVIKFEGLLQKSLALGAAKVATGHYARIEQDSATGRYRLGRGIDANKDQSYALFNMTQEQLSRTLFPLGGFTKPEIREKAAQLGLAVASKPDSQEICFIPDNDYRRFLEERYPDHRFQPGPFVDQEGNVIGTHRGLPFYTVGQRKGLGVAFGFPAYVIALDVEHNAVVIGPDEAVKGRRLLADDLNWIDIAGLKAPMEVEAKIRYSASPAIAVISPVKDGSAVIVEFAAPQRAITPGQAVVFYRGDWVVGGGTIVRNLDLKLPEIRHPEPKPVKGVKAKGRV